jgi:hypothetical protein
MGLLERFVELSRGRSSDRAKAQWYVAERAREAYRDLVADFDAFARHQLDVRDPALLVGTARDSSGADVRVRIPLDELYCHWLVSGGTGAGKTTFVTSVVADMLRTGFPVGVLDCKSGFFDAAIQWAGVIAHALPPGEREAFVRRLVVANPFGETLVPLNVCRLLPGTSAEVQAYEVSLALSRLFDSAMGFQMENILRHLVLLLMEADLTLAEAPMVLQDELLRGLLAERSQHPGVREFFLRTYPGVPMGSKDALLARLQSLLLPENLRLMLGADDLLDLKGALDRGDPVFVFLGKGPGVPEEQVEVIGSLFLQLLFQAAFAAGRGRRPYQIVCDEFFHLLDAPGLGKRFETALTTFRSFGVTLSLVMHNFAQIPGTLRETILANCDVIATFRTSSRNAQFFGEFLPESDPEILSEALRKTGKPPAKFEMKSQLVERLQRLPNRMLYWYDRRRPYRAVPVRARDVPPPHEAAGLDEEGLERFIDEAGIRLGGAGLPKAALQRQVDRRRERLAEFLRSVVRPGPESVQAPPSAPDGLRRNGKPRLG